MKNYGCTFQHAETGLWVSATYESKILKLEMYDSLEDMLPFISSEEVYKETERWIKEKGNRKFESVEDAQNYLQTMGNDVDFEC